MKNLGAIQGPKSVVNKEYVDGRLAGYRTSAAQDMIDAGKQAKIAASGMLKGDGNGGVTAATAGTDYQAPLVAGTDYETPAGAKALGLTGASAGDLVRVNAVDANGKPTSWKHVPLCEVKTNPNLLDNWYFIGGGSQQGGGQLPINQRGQTIYSNVGYCIDRWRTWETSNSTEVTQHNITITRQIAQVVNQALIAGRTITISALFSDDELLTATGVITMVSGTAKVLLYAEKTDFANVMLYYDGSTIISFQINLLGSQAGTATGIKAAKIELGSEQTLAHQENGVWVLNEIPDYGEELRKCQRYLFRLDNNTGEASSQNFLGYAQSATQLRIPVALPVSIALRKNATVTVQGNIGSCSVYDQNGNGFAATSITAFWRPVTNQIMMIVECSNATFNANTLCRFQLGAVSILFSYEP